jgi:hypothetical protein
MKIIFIVIFLATLFVSNVFGGIALRCTDRTLCSDCKSTANCKWCPNQARCRDIEASNACTPAPINGTAICPQTSPPTPMPIECNVEGVDSCDECMRRGPENHCVWCDDGTCASSSYASYYGDSCLPPKAVTSLKECQSPQPTPSPIACSERSNCAQCVPSGDFDCVWCIGTSSCLASEDRPNCSGSVRYDDEQCDDATRLPTPPTPLPASAFCFFAQYCDTCVRNDLCHWCNGVCFGREAPCPSPITNVNSCDDSHTVSFWL